MNTLKIEEFKKGQEILIHNLIKEVYDEFVAKDCTDAGNRFFYDWIEPMKILKRQKDQINLWVALVNTRIVGIIEIRDNNNITLLYVSKEHHGKDIAKQLFNRALKESIGRNVSLSKFYVHASTYSVPIYKKLGFTEISEIQEEHGIKYIPMEMILKNNPQIS